MHEKHSFPPILPHQPRLLILGSSPGDRSIELQQYYGHSRNRFWPLMYLLLEGKPETTPNYQDRKSLLHHHKIALWDVAKIADRKGSMDADIKEIEPNEIEVLLSEIPSIKKVIFNGQKAAQLYAQFFKNQSTLDYYTLPSTSPANARFQLPELLESWAVITE